LRGSKFITFEGVEGCGKTTQLNLLASALRERGIDTLITREPGGTPLGQEIRKLLLNPLSKGDPLTNDAELLLFCADRAHHVESLIRPALDEGRIVLCDRYIDSTTAYQGYGRGINLDLIKQCHEIATNGLLPDATFFLDLPPKVGLRRAHQTNNEYEGGDRIESSSVQFWEKVRVGFNRILLQEPERMIWINADQSPEAVAQDIWGYVENCLGPKQDAV